MALQADAPGSEGLRPKGPAALSERPSDTYLVAVPPPPPVEGDVVELIGHPMSPPRFATRTAIDNAVEFGGPPPSAPRDRPGGGDRPAR